MVLFFGAARAATFNVASGDVDGLISAMYDAQDNGDSANVINLAGGVFTLSWTEEDDGNNGPNGLPIISGGKTLTINGNSAEITCDHNDYNFRIFQVGKGEAGTALVLNRLTLTNGDPDGGSGTYYGGAILTSDTGGGTTSVTMTDCNVSYNTAACGGGICAMRSNLTLTRCTIENNTANGDSTLSFGYGGGIWHNMYADLNLTDCAIRNNTITCDNGFGAGLAENSNGYGSQSFYLTRCTISGNAVTGATSVGGGIFMGNGIGSATREMYLDNCTISGNSVNDGNGGGLYVYANDGYDWGTTYSYMHLTSCTVTGNYASNDGGGFYTETGTDNSGAEAALSLRNTILAGNSADNTGPDADDPSGNSWSDGYNLIGDATGISTSGTDWVGNITLGLDVLADNGGFTQTHAIDPWSSSTAVGNGESSLLGSTDQRGVVRNGVVDIGAYQIAPSIYQMSITPNVVSEGTGTVVVAGNFDDPFNASPYTVTVDWLDGTPPQTFPGYTIEGPSYFNSPPHTLGPVPPGVLFPEVTLTGDNGRSVTRKDVPLLVVNQAPTAAIVLPAGPYLEGAALTVTGTATDPGTTDTFSYIWRVTKNGADYTSATNGPGMATSDTLIFTPDDNGTYLVSLTVVDASGAMAVATQTITVDNVAPVLSNVALSSTTINEGDTVTLSGDIADPGTLDWFTLTVDWGDGSAAQDHHLDAGSKTFSVTHKYLDNPASGPSYTIKVSIVDKDGAGGAQSLIADPSFENNYTGWTLSHNMMFGDAAWGIATSGQTINDGDSVHDFATGSSVTVGDNLSFVATSGSSVAYLYENGPGTHRMYQDVNLPSDATTLTWDMSYENFASDFSNNQQIAVSILDTSDNLLQTLFVTQSGDPLSVSPLQNYSADITAFAGQHVRLDITCAVLNSELIVAFDNFSIVRTGPAELITNGGFESGDFSGWNTNVTNEPFQDWTVSTAGNGGGEGGLAPTAPVEGSYDAWNGFDGAGPMQYTMYQDISIPAGGTALSWQDRVQWNMADFSGSTAARTYSVQVQDPETSDVLATLYSFSAQPNTKGNTGWLSHSGDLSAFAGMTVRIVFVEDIPENFTGPGQLELDAITTTAIPGFATISLLVNNVAPSNIALSLAATTINELGVASLSGTFTDPGVLDTHTVLIDWGDGNTDTLDLAAGVQSFGPVSHPYTEALDIASLTDTITVTVTDKDGDSGTSSINLTINNVGPTVAITGAPASSSEGASISLNSAVTDPGGEGESYSYQWTVSGGNYTDDLSGGTNSDYTFTPTAPGNYTVTLTVADRAGATGSDTKQIMVVNVPPSVSIMLPEARFFPEGSPITVTGNVSDETSNEVFTYSWTILKDGTTFTSGTTTNGEGPGPGPGPFFAFQAQTRGVSQMFKYSSDFTFVPLDNGVYTVCLTVIDAYGAAAVATQQTITVVNVAPTLNNLLVTPDTISEGESVTITGDITDPGVLDWFTLGVDWGDGSAAQTYHLDAGSTSFSITHQYLDNPSSGPSYSVALWLTDKDGGAAGEDNGDVLNGSFEDGLTDWTVEESGIADTVSSLGTIAPQDGSNFLIMDTGDGASATDTSAYSALCGNGTVSSGTLGTVVTQTFTLSARTTLSFQWNYLTNESQYSEYDFAIGELLDGGMNVVARLFAANSSIGVDATGSGYERQSGWHGASFTVPADDSYTLRFVVTHTGDNEVSSGLAVDYVTTVLPADLAVAVNNVAPSKIALTLTPGTINEGGSTSLSGTFSDPGVLDTHTVGIAWGDGTTDTLNLAAGVLSFGPVSHSFTQALVQASITNTITVTVTDKDGDSDSTTTDLTINNVKPSVAITGAFAVSPTGSPIPLGSTVSDPGQADTFTYLWSVVGGPFTDAGNGGASYTFMPEVPGNYAVNLTVTDAAGQSGSDTKYISVLDSGASVAIVGAPVSCPEGTAVALTGVTNAPAPLTYAWNVAKNGVAGFATGTAASFTFTPDDNGVYTVTLSMTSGGNAVGTVQRAIIVTNVAPKAAVAAPAAAVEGTTLTLTSSVSDPGAADVTAGFQYLWIISANGAVVASGNSATLKFTPAAGNYVASLSVTDKDGGTGLTTATFDATPVFASAPTATPNPAQVGEQVQFTCAATANLVRTWSWDFGDGTTDNSGNSSVTHAYTSAGSYIVTVTATDAAGNAVSKTLVVAVMSIQSPNTHELVTFLGASSPFEGAAPAPQPLTVSMLRVRLDFIRGGHDKIQLRGIFQSGAMPSLNGQLFAIGIGGVMKSFTLDAKGSAKSGADKMLLSARKSKFVVFLNNGDFKAAMAKSGLTGMTVEGVQKDLTVTIIFNGIVYERIQRLHYTALFGKYGLAN
jgi:PKD repeat protein